MSKKSTIRLAVEFDGANLVVHDEDGSVLWIEPYPDFPEGTDEAKRISELVIARLIAKAAGDEIDTSSFKVRPL